ncbi:MAG: ABC transporter substrate-binding protein [Dethiobacteria bacterium]
MKKFLSILIVVAMLLLGATAAFAADTTYIVKKGDTLAKIGKAYGLPYTEIAEKNSIKNPNLILIGQKLIIPGGETVAPKPVTPLPAPQPAPATGKVTVTDVTGRLVTLDKPASKILGTHNPSLNTAIVLGGGDKYIAGFGNKKMADKLYDFVMKDYDGIVEIGKGGNVNFETVLTLGKNNVAILPERFKDQVKQFENVGLQAVVALPNAESFDTIKKSLEIVGKVLGIEGRAKDINALIDKNISETKKVVENVKARPSVLFLGSSSSFSVATSSMIQTDIIEMAGGTNAVKGVEVQGAFADVNIEQIIAWNPEIIWVPKYATYTVESLLSDAKWGSIKAIKDKKVYVFPSELEPWDYPTASAVLGLRWGLHSLHPELYSLNSLMKNADEFYSLVYGVKFTAQQLGIE